MVAVLSGDTTTVTSLAPGGRGDAEAKHSLLVLVTGRAKDGDYSHGSPDPAG